MYFLLGFIQSSDYEPATRFCIDEEVLSGYIGKAFELRDKGLDNAVTSVWHAIPDLPRNVMITMWLSRLSHLRTSVAHPIPAVWEGLSIIVSDLYLSEAEKEYARQLIPVAVDKRAKRLFTEN